MIVAPRIMECSDYCGVEHEGIPEDREGVVEGDRLTSTDRGELTLTSLQTHASQTTTDTQGDCLVFGKIW